MKLFWESIQFKSAKKLEYCLAMVNTMHCLFLMDFLLFIAKYTVTIFNGSVAIFPPTFLVILMLLFRIFLIVSLYSFYASFFFITTHSWTNYIFLASICRKPLKWRVQGSFPILPIKKLTFCGRLLYERPSDTFPYTCPSEVPFKLTLGLARWLILTNGTLANKTQAET